MGNIIYNGINFTKKTYEPKKPPLVSWSTGTDDEIVAMVNGYYDGILSIDDIKSVWNLGDCRSVDLAAMPATYVSESHRAQTVELQILDFEHDDLTTAIGDKTKALMTVDLKDCLIASGNPYGNDNSENGYMNYPSTTTGGWASCKRRTWCNNVFYKSLPDTFKNLVKIVKKKTSDGSYGGSKLITSSDYCFLLSEIEIFGNVTYSRTGEGIQYAWFANATANRYKLPKYTQYSKTSRYLERSPSRLDTAIYCVIDELGTSSRVDASSLAGISPAFCL